MLRQMAIVSILDIDGGVREEIKCLATNVQVEPHGVTLRISRGRFFYPMHRVLQIIETWESVEDKPRSA